MRLHDDELEIDDGVVRRLVDRDLPQLAAQPLRRLPASGSSNVLFRLGAEYVVRLPRQPGGSRTMDTEARWGAHVAPTLPVVVPEALAVGEPGFGYPERWALTRWIAGAHPATPVPSGPAAHVLAHELAAFVSALHAVPVPEPARSDPGLRSYRAGSLRAVDGEIRDYLEQCRRVPGLALDVDAGLDLWAEAVELPESAGPDCWVHGDLLAENVLVSDDRLHAVLDFGGLAVGDPSVDLVVAWEVLPPPARAEFRTRLGVSDTTWLRGRGWALAIAAMTFPYYWRTMPARCTTRLAMARQVLADAGHCRDGFRR